jgi:hypothetical protein
MNFFETLAHLFHPRRSNNHRPKVLHPEALSYLAVVALVFSLAVTFSPKLFLPLENILGYASSITTDEIISLTNAERAKQGLSAVTYNETLSNAAAEKGNDMFANQYWAHTSPAGKEPWAFITEAGYSYRVAGENLARDFSASGQVVAAWMASPTHRANVVNNRYTEIGVAVVDGTLDGVETTLVVQMFGSPRAQIAQVAQVNGSSANEKSTTELPASTPPVVAEQTPPIAISTSPTPAVPASQQPEEVSILPTSTTGAVVLGGAVLPASVLNSPLVSPLQLTKAFFLSILLLLIVTLVYDLLLIESRRTVRFVGKNVAHILLFIVVAFLVIFFKGGVVG